MLADADTTPQLPTVVEISPGSILVTVLIMILVALLVYALKRKWYAQLVVGIVFVAALVTVVIGYYFLFDDRADARPIGALLVGLSLIIMTVLAVFVKRSFG